MPDQSLIVSPGPDEKSVLTASGEVLRPPPDWVLLPPGDATFTRRLKTSGPTWTVQQKRGRKVFSLGVWAPQTIVERIRSELTAERSTAAYQKRRTVEITRRQRQQAEYVEDFQQAVLDFLAFDAKYASVAKLFAQAVTAHSTPVGSGTVARTRRISIERRAEAAVIAWLRHQTTGYDDLKIARVKGKRREVRRLLAEQSRRLLDAYRRGAEIDAACPLRRALDAASEEGRAIQVTSN
jgi:hypothetical protein